MYYYIIAVLSFFSFALKNVQIKDRKLFLLACSYILFTLLFFISSFRDNVGTDFQSYRNIFENETPIEPLFGYLIKFVKYFGCEYEVFVFLVFAIAFGLKVYVFHKLSYEKGFFLSLMFFCSFYYIAYDINAIRQGLALSLTLLACYFAYIQSKLKFYIACITAVFIHYTAIVFLPFYLILRIKLTKIQAIAICIVCVIASLNGVFPELVDFSTNLLKDFPVAYFIKGYGSSIDSIIFSFSTLRRLFFFTLILYSYDKIIADGRLKQIIFWGNLLSIMIYFICADVPYFSTRLSSYYRIIECVWLSYFPFVFQKSNNKILVCIFYLTYSFLQINSALSLEDNHLLPIKTIFG